MTPADADELIVELPRYLAATQVVEGAVENETPEEWARWWKIKSSDLPKWSAFARRCALQDLQPSSAPAERVFSLLRQRFTDKQRTSLEESIETSVMVAYNGRRRRERDR